MHSKTVYFLKGLGVSFPVTHGLLRADQQKKSYTSFSDIGDARFRSVMTLVDLLHVHVVGIVLVGHAK